MFDATNECQADPAECRSGRRDSEEEEAERRRVRIRRCEAARPSRFENQQTDRVFGTNHPTPHRKVQDLSAVTPNPVKTVIHDTGVPRAHRRPSEPLLPPRRRLRVRKAKRRERPRRMRNRRGRRLRPKSRERGKRRSRETTRTRMRRMRSRRRSRKRCYYLPSLAPIPPRARARGV